ncbi:gp53-like domain-containing protein [Chromobacterium paludis]|uniref:Putative tail fiber protein gp53-like C-terminal domain-containing protein n=1 Tax=Chromobacterium paludis TaxID=2605945 RepID=A0A5C1DLV8_9NEIS|nr:hypothetical protein [Chromobacterium paludis]QEL57039.1 hypothetical protein FYK34_16460 [Chromobacterium paludis]
MPESKADKASTLAGYGINDGATKSDLKAAIDGLVAGAPGALNTLKELADALGSDGNFAATVTNKLATKSDKATTLTGYGITDAAGSVFSGSNSLNTYTVPGVYEYDPVVDGAPTSIPNHTVLSMGRVARWTQLAIPYRKDQLFFRRNIDGNRGEWQEVWHGGNFRPELKADKATTLAGYGITDATSKDANNRSWASAFRASKGLPNGDESRTGFAFETDGDTGLFADGSGISGSSALGMYIDSSKVFQVGRGGQIWSPLYGALEDKFAAKSSTLAGYGITDAVSINGNGSKTFNVANATSAAHAVAYGQFASSLVPTGYQYLPNGMLLQWGKTPGIAGAASYTGNFAIAFPNGVFSMTASSYLDTNNSEFFNVFVVSNTQYRITSGAVAAQSAPVTWIAIGY